MAVTPDTYQAPWGVVTFFALSFVAAIYLIAVVGARVVLTKNASFRDKFTFIWLAFDGLIHFCVEGPFLYSSTGGRTINTSTGILAEMWRDYARADTRWGTADPTVVSLEVLTVLGAGPICFYILYLMTKRDPARHFWIVVLSTAELYGGWMTFAPDLLDGGKSLILDPTNILDFWIYLVFLNILWVFIPIYLLFDSYGEISKSLRAAQKAQTVTKTK
ncbi:Emopamil-binding protein [Exidia glandulosa HHB12029]|uniref:Emopamil-binding protein n=1 Tax=Exidia glandulosa HHB12029 TaxID=1314781 RepID=A0A165DH49_EXIGL|nr:Emopamil-binding protein [Exidia glandulosa HHB12029]